MRAALSWVVAIALWAVISAAAWAAETLDGEYYGIDDAAGATIRIKPDPGGFRGTFYDRFGKIQDFEADRVGDAAEAVLDMDGQTVLLRIEPLPFGAQVAVIPVQPDGRLALDVARSLGFVRQGIQLPERPTDYVDAPRSDCQRIAAYSFLSSYAFWPPAGVLNGYMCLAERHRVLLRMFPALQLDVIWKLCLAPGADQALATALRGQGVDCGQVLDGIADTQRSGRFNDYKKEVDAEREALSTSVRCADNYVMSKKTCDDAARRLSQAAISLRTSAMVLDSYR